MRRTRGFTLIELMVVITIIALLLTILLPGLAKALELARRAKCGANLKGIGEGLTTKDAEKVMYRSGGSGLPWADNTQAAAPHLVNGSTGSARVKDPWGDVADRAAQYPVTTNVYALIHKADVDAAAFVCPSTGDQVDEDIVDDDGEKFWDFVENANISYSYQAPIDTTSGEQSPFTNAHSSVVIMADQNPISVPALESNGQPCEDDGETLTTWEGLGDDIEEPHQGTMRGQSPNHRGEYVNALRYDGTLKTSFMANIGYDKDCIWTPGTATNGAGALAWENRDYAGPIDVDNGSAYTVTDHKKANDSFLIDTPNLP